MEPSQRTEIGLKLENKFLKQLLFYQYRKKMLFSHKTCILLKILNNIFMCISVKIFQCRNVSICFYLSSGEGFCPIRQLKMMFYVVIYYIDSFSNQAYNFPIKVFDQETQARISLFILVTAFQYPCFKRKCSLTTSNEVKIITSLLIISTQSPHRLVQFSIFEYLKNQYLKLFMKSLPLFPFSMLAYEREKILT